MVKTPPDGWHTITPRIFVDDVEKLIEFLKHTFHATGEFRAAMPSEIRIGDSLVMISGTGPRDAKPAFLYVYVDDVDATYQRAVQAGATSLEAPLDMPYGDRRGMVRDAFGNVWQIATRRENLSIDEIRRRGVSATRSAVPRADPA
jgi:PhnB protein